MKPRITKEILDDYQTTNPVSDRLWDEHGKDGWQLVFNYARVALHLEEYHPELFMMIEKILKGKTQAKDSQP